MKYVVLTTLCSLMAANIAFAGERVDERMTVAKDVTVEIEHSSGDIKIRGWDKTEVTVVGELDERAKKFIFEERKGRVLIKVKMPKVRNWNESKGGDDLDIRVPFGSEVRYTGINADAEIFDLRNGLQATTVNGSIEAQDIAGRVALQSVNGDIDSRNLSGDLRLETVNGRIRDRNSSGTELNLDSINGDIESAGSINDVTVETVNGSIELDLNEVDKLEMSTVNGTIEVSMHLLKNGDVEGSTVSGEIDLSMQPDVSARFDVQAHAGGSIINRLTDHQVSKAKYGPGRWLEFDLQGGRAKVDLSTVSGRIVLDSAKP